MSSLKYLTTFIVSLFCTATTYASFENTSYSYFGVGMDYISYQEKTSGFGIYSFESSYTAFAPIQRSGGYTAIDNDFGFFINTASTLIASDKEEEWDINGFGVVQTDTMTVNRSDLQIMGAYQFQNGHYLSFGGQYHSTKYSRFDFQSTNNTAAFNADIYVNDPTYLGLLARVNNPADNGVQDADGVEITTEAQLREVYSFDPEVQSGVIFEDAVSVSAVVGYGFDSYHLGEKSGWRNMWHFTLGTPLYESVLNTANNRSLTASFSGGVDFQAHIATGWQFNKNVSLLASLETNYIFRNEIRDKIGSQDLILPENTLHTITPQLSFYWNF